MEKQELSIHQQKILLRGNLQANKPIPVAAHLPRETIDKLKLIKRNAEIQIAYQAQFAEVKNHNSLKNKGKKC